MLAWALYGGEYLPSRLGRFVLRERALVKRKSNAGLDTHSHYTHWAIPPPFLLALPIVPYLLAPTEMYPIPDIIGFFNWPNPSSRTIVPGVDIASNRNEYQASSWG
jgi:hypothetical protein